MNPFSQNLDSVHGDLSSQHDHQVGIANVSQSPGPLNLPRQHLLHEERRDEYLRKCLPLEIAAINGDWEAAKYILDQDNGLVRCSINENNETPLHVAVYAGRSRLFVENLLKLMENEDMELRNNSSNTALCLAAVAGHVSIANILLTKHNALLDMTGSQQKTPLYMAVVSRKRHMVDYLFKKSEKMSGPFWTDESRTRVLLKCIKAELFDVALDILDERPELAQMEDRLLGVLAQKPRAFRQQMFHSRNEAMKLLRKIWQIIIELPMDRLACILKGPADMDGKHPSRVLFVATRMGNTAFVVELIQRMPTLVLERDDINQTIFHVAVSHRNSEIYNMLHKVGGRKELILYIHDLDGNNMLHLAGLPRKTSIDGHYKNTIIQGPVVEMREEQCWFQILEEALPFSLGEKKNKDGLTPKQLFNMNHKELTTNCVELIKKTCSYLVVVVVLLATLSLGYEQGNPTFSGNVLFNGFIASKSMSFVMACLSIGFASYLSSSNRGSVSSLPHKLTLAKVFVCGSVMCVILALIFSLFLLYQGMSSKIPYILMASSIGDILLFIYWVREYHCSVSTSNTKSRLRGI